MRKRLLILSLTHTKNNLLKTFVIIWSKGKNFPSGKSFWNAPLEEHVNYIKTAFDTGTVIMAGPFADGESGMTIYNASDETNANLFAQNDPEYKKGVLEYKITEYKPLFKQ